MERLSSLGEKATVNKRDVWIIGQRQISRWKVAALSSDSRSACLACSECQIVPRTEMHGNHRGLRSLVGGILIFHEENGEPELPSKESEAFVSRWRSCPRGCFLCRKISFECKAGLFPREVCARTLINAFTSRNSWNNRGVPERRPEETRTVAYH